MQIVLTGDEKKIRAAAEKLNVNVSDFETFDCPDVITMEDEPTAITRAKKQSSMAVGLRALAEGKGDAFASAGNSGALVVGATLLVKRIKGVKRVAFAPLMPKSEGFFMLADGGANNECRPEMLEQLGMWALCICRRSWVFKSRASALQMSARSRTKAANCARGVCTAERKQRRPFHRQH